MPDQQQDLAQASQLFDAPVEAAPTWAPENTPAPPPKPLWCITVEKTAECEVWVRADNREEADALAKDIKRHFYDDYRDARDFFDGTDMISAYAYNKPGQPEKGDPIWDGDGDWEDAE